jgi:hypothetical protein
MPGRSFGIRSTRLAALVLLALPCGLTAETIHLRGSAPAGARVEILPAYPGRRKGGRAAAAGHPVAGALVRWKGEPVAVTGPRGRVEIAAPEGDPLTVESATGEQAKLVPKPGGAVLKVQLVTLPRERGSGNLTDASCRG